MNNGNVHPNEVRMCYEDIPVSSEFIEKGDAITTFIEKYEEFKADIWNWKYRKTAKFWVLYYMDVLSNIIQIHHAVQTNNFGLRLDGLKKALPFCFALNKQSYACYGTIYVHSLDNIDTTNPGCKKLLLNKGLSVQAQSCYPLRTSIDQCGTSNWSRRKKLCWIKSFVSNKESILKWALSWASFTKLRTHKLCIKCRSSRPDVFCEKGVLRNLAKFTGKHLCQSPFFNKVAGAASNFIKKETLAKVFSCEFCEISKNIFFTKHVWATASLLPKSNNK